MNPMKRFLVFLIRCYRFLLSPWVGQQCRFYPSCSNYAEQAIIEHGAIIGSFMAAKRLCKCHPWHEGGIDPVPPNNCTH